MTQYKAVLFDLGGVVFNSPVEKLIHYEKELGLPPRTILHKMNYAGLTGLMASLETGQIMPDEFAELFEKECRADGINLSGKKVMKLLGNVTPRPEFISAIKNIRKRGLKVVAITNNWKLEKNKKDDVREIFSYFDFVIQSSEIGIRKPDPRIYQLTLQKLQLPASACLFLDDLGQNLKPARELGITTILVDYKNPLEALVQLSEHLQFSVIDTHIQSAL